jgi:hypothetical protein
VGLSLPIFGLLQSAVVIQSLLRIMASLPGASNNASGMGTVLA